MHIGISKIVLRIPENQSLKGKRRVVKSLMDRIKNQFNVSICEVENQNQWQLATIGMACINSDSQYLNRTLSKILDFVITNSGDFELLDHKKEIISGI